jgi:TIR domain-containing protein
MANGQRLRIFVSHAAEDTDTAQRVALALLQEGYQIFFDRTSLSAGLGFNRAIRDEICEADLFVFLISPAAVAEGRYTWTELKFAQEKWPNPSGRILPVMALKTDWKTIPPYLAAVIVLEPKGNLVAEVVDSIKRLIDDGHLTTDENLTKSSQGVLPEEYRDSLVESVRKQLIQLPSQKAHEEISLRSRVFPILRGLFVGRNTFEEKVAECHDETWGRRFIAAVETRRLMEAYRPIMISLAKAGDEGLVQSYDQLKLHRYLQELTGLFSPRAEVGEIAEKLREGDLEAVEKELRKAEIHPKERIDPNTVTNCDERQSLMREIWEKWPIF